MHGSMPWKTLQPLCKIDQTMDIFLFLISFTKFRIHPQRLIYRDIKLLRDHLCNGIHLCIRHIQNTADIADNTSRCQRTKSNDLNHAVIAVFPSYIIDNLLSSFEAEVNINIRHGYSFRIQKTLKQQVITDRIQLSNPKCVGNQASCGRASARANHNVIIPGIFNEIPHNEKIIHISHIFNGSELIIQTLLQFLCYRMVPLFQSLMAKLVQIFPGSKPVRHIIFRQLGHTEFDLHMTSLGYLMGIFQSFQSIWKKSCHLFRRFHVILTALIAHSVLICKFLLCLQAKKHVMGLRILSHGVMHIIGSNQINACLSVHAEKLLVYSLLLRNSMILQLQKKIPFSKNILITQGCDLRILVHTPCKVTGYFSGQAGT